MQRECQCIISTFTCKTSNNDRHGIGCEPDIGRDGGSIEFASRPGLHDDVTTLWVLFTLSIAEQSRSSKESRIYGVLTTDSIACSRGVQGVHLQYFGTKDDCDKAIDSIAAQRSEDRHYCSCLRSQSTDWGRFSCLTEAEWRHCSSRFLSRSESSKRQHDNRHHAISRITTTRSDQLTTHCSTRRYQQRYTTKPIRQKQDQPPQDQRHQHLPPITKPYATSLAHEAITVERQLYIPHPDDALLDPGTARVNLAVFNETPNGTPSWREKHAHQTVLQQHCSYWDPDADGIIWPLDIYRGCAAWGWHPLLCLLVTIIIAGSMSYPTLPAGRYLPDLWFRIYLNNIHKCKHGSDSNTYDQEGRFRPQQFEDFFAKYDAGSKRGVDLYDLARAHKGQRLLCDPFGWTASMLEWLALYLLIWPKDGILSKDDCRASYDGSIYQRKADEFAAKRIR